MGRNHGNGGTGRGGRGGRGGRSNGITRETNSQDSNHTATQIDRPALVNKFILGNFHKHINGQPISSDVCVQSGDRQTLPACDPFDFQNIISNKDISSAIKHVLVFFQLHSKGCLVCTHISNTNGVKYTLLPHLCMPGRDRPQEYFKRPADINRAY